MATLFRVTRVNHPLPTSPCQSATNRDFFFFRQLAPRRAVPPPVLIRPICLRERRMLSGLVASPFGTGTHLSPVLAYPHSRSKGVSNG